MEVFPGHCRCQAAADHMNGIVMAGHSVESVEAKEAQNVHPVVAGRYSLVEREELYGIHQ